MDFSSPGAFFASFLVGLVGLGVFMYGKRQNRMSSLWVGLAMMIYPYFVTGTAAMLGIGAVLLGGLWMVGRTTG